MQIKRVSRSSKIYFKQHKNEISVQHALQDVAKSYSEGNRLLKANNGEDVSDHSPAVQTKELENQTLNKHNSKNNHKKKKLDLRN